MGNSKLKRKILILCSKGGYGHISASHSIQEVFQDQYIFQEVFPIEESHRFGKNSGENFYNLLLKNDLIRMTNFMSNSLAPLWFQAKKASHEALFLEMFQREKPDLVLSIIPFINYPASEAARKCNIPYLLVTTDNDLRHWVLGLKELKHPAFKVTIGRDLHLTRGVLSQYNINEQCIEVTGLPVHPDFLEEKEPEIIKKEFGIPLDKPVITIIMGGAGGKGAFAYAKLLEEMNLPLHVVICTGNNKPLYEKMKPFALLKGAVTFSILSFTDRIADLMEISNLLITKPGPGTINEAMVKKLPILLDNTGSALSWERINQELVVDLGIGQVLDKPEDAKTWVFKYLYDKEIQKEVDQSYRRIRHPSFSENIQRVVSSLIEPSFMEAAQLVAKA